MKILVLIKEKLNGVLFYRGVIPHSYMIGRHDVQIHFRDNILMLSDKELSSFDIVHASYWFCGDEHDRLRVNRLGVKLIIDIDDYWEVDRYHELYDNFKESNHKKIVTDLIKSADAITTTTTQLADKVRIYNDVVGIFPNALMDDNYINRKKNKIPFFAWIGGANHTSDLMLIQHLQKGFGNPVYVPEMYRSIFKDRFLYYAPQQIPNYLGLYNEYDVILVSLRESKFNKLKSPLKIMEAGMFSRPVIVSGTDPFREYLKHKENCLVVRKKSEWGKWAKLLANDKQMRKELGINLHTDMLLMFDLEKITKRRYGFYKGVLSAKNAKNDTSGRF